MKKVYVIIEYPWIRDTNKYSGSTYMRAIIATLDKVKEWLLDYCDYLIQDAYEWCDEETYLQDKEHYNLVKEYYEKRLELYTEETFSIGKGMGAYGFSIECVEVIE
jgi:hypothetical protein